MKARILLLPLVLLFLLAFTQCAKRGRPSGGAIDSIPPKPLRIFPENYQTNFSSNKITILFDEYIRLDKLQENLLISPPMEKTPIITPYSTSRTLEIEITEDLLPNTTYTFNFGNSIVDNNEGNILPSFEYIFSTGTYIDSLELRGKVTDSRLLKLKEKVGVNLYLLDETYHDSLLVKGKPNYVSQTDEEGNFRFTNLAEGNYLLTAVSQGKGGTPYSYNPAQDKFAFHSNTIKIPSDSLYNLFLYQQEADYKINRPEMIGENQIRFAYQGNNQLPEIELQEMPSDLQTRIIKETDKDTLYFWYHPILERDSLEFKVISRDTSQILKLKRKEDAQATKFKLHKLDLKTPQDTVSFRSDTPLKNKDEQFISLVNQDSTSIEFKTSVDLLYNTLYVIFEKDYESNYQLQLLPGAVTDWQGVTNDSLEFNYRIRPESDFGSLHLNIQNITHFPVRVDLLNDNSKLIRTDYLNEERSVDFLNLSNGTYFVRLSYDLNKNRKWDTGNFKKRIQPEPVFFFHIPIEVHPNWSVNEVLRVP